MVSFFRITIRLFEGQPLAVAGIRLLSADAYGSRRIDYNLGSYTKLYLDPCQFQRLAKMKMAGMRHCTYRSDSSGITDYMRRPMNRPDSAAIAAQREIAPPRCCGSLLRWFVVVSRLNLVGDYVWGSVGAFEHGVGFVVV